MSRRSPKSSRSAAENVTVFFRMHQGLTQAEFAKACGLTTLDISKIERGIFKIKLRKMLNLASYLSVPVDAIINNRFESALSAFHEPPAVNEKAEASLRKAHNSRMENGLKGQDLVVAMEREKLQGTPFCNAVNANYALDPAFGFDVLSFDHNGEVIYIEVKASSEAKESAFIMTASEVAFMEECRRNGKRYEVHRILNVNRRPKRIIYSLADLEKFSYAPNEYLVSKEAQHERH